MNFNIQVIDFCDIAPHFESMFHAERDVLYRFVVLHVDGEKEKLSVYVYVTTHTSTRGGA